MRARLARICAIGRARKPSLPPSSRITIARMVQHQRARQAGEAARRGFAADAGVDDLVTVPLLLEPRLQQRHPALLHARQPVAGTDAVAEHEDRRRLGVCRSRRQPQRPTRTKSRFTGRSQCKIKSFSKPRICPKPWRAPRARSPFSPMSASVCEPARRSPSSALRAPANRRCWRCSRGSIRRAPATCSIAGVDITLLDEDGRAAHARPACRLRLPVVPFDPLAHGRGERHAAARAARAPRCPPGGGAARSSRSG